MKYFLGFVAGIIFIFLILNYLPESEGRYYDCGMAEWHPDIPTQVKEECRKLRIEQWKKEYDNRTI
jgi:hypothetical protein